MRVPMQSTSFRLAYVPFQFGLLSSVLEDLDIVIILSSTLQTAEVHVLSYRIDWLRSIARTMHRIPTLRNASSSVPREVARAYFRSSRILFC